MNVKAKKNEDQRILQQERLILQICLHINKLMEDKKVSKSELARRLGVTPPRVTQILDGVNLGIRQVSDVMFALDSSLNVNTGSIGFSTTIKPKDMPNLKFDDYGKSFSSNAWREVV